MLGHDFLHGFRQVYELDFVFCGNSYGFVMDVQLASPFAVSSCHFVFKACEKVKSLGFKQDSRLG